MRRQDTPATIDFESFKIEPRPQFPPEPVSVAIKLPGKKARFYAWGHVAGGNNCTYAEALAALKAVWNSDHSLLFQNAKFDVAVATERMGLKMPRWDRIHDTMFLLFLDNPYAPNFSLKPSAQRLLGWAPEEQDAVRDWLLEHKKWVKEQTGENVTDKNFGKFIAYAPGNVVQPYCLGDVDRTEALFDLLHPSIIERKMLEAYDTERELMPILLRNEQDGMRVALPKLDKDKAMYETTLERMDDWLRKKLNAPDLNVDTDAQLADALDEAGVVTEWVYTAPSKTHPNGVKSVAKGNLTLEMFTDPKIFRALTYRNKLAYSLATFMRPWSATAHETKGTIHTDWRQVPRQGAGAVTGRMSSSPNFMNITKNIVEDGDKYVHPAFIKWAPPLPSLRQYILPDRGQMFGHRDFSQQELRILAHFENGPLMAAYQADPHLDVHVMVQQLLADAGAHLDRSDTKGFNFGILYGMGATGLSKRLGVQKEEARGLIATWNAVMPGVSSLIQDIKDEVRGGGEICTWNGRRYGMPPPMLFGSEQRDRDYVLLNYLIQGSGADATKRAIIEFDKKKKDSRLLVSVHDEINFSCPAGAMAQEQKILKKVIENLPFDVPMLSDGKAGTNWGTAKKWKD